METPLTSLNPLSYQQWVSIQNPYTPISQSDYLNYLNEWYTKTNLTTNNNTVTVTKKEQYIQLVKDLIILFNADERDLFLSEIDYNKDEDLIYVIPYLAHKLKEISQILVSKREQLKNSKFKHSLIGSNLGLEKILYEYVLKNFTKKDYSYTKVPISPLADFFPQLSSVKDDFFIEIEELYDAGNYFDSDPSVPIKNYLNSSSTNTKTPFDNLSDEQLTALISARFIDKVSPTPLSKLFKNYLTSISTLSTAALSGALSFQNAQINNQISLNEKYLSESVYGLTAIKLKETSIPDYSLNLNFSLGNNWFFWPSGDKITNESQVGNVFKPIALNSSNFFVSGFSGSKYQDSDMIFKFVDDIIVDAAWLQATRTVQTSATVSMNIYPNELRNFIFPYVGFDIDSKNLGFKNYTLNDSNYLLYQTFAPEIKKKILENYYSSNFSNSASNEIYINQTNLIDSGSHADVFDQEADTIIKFASSQIYPLWTDNSLGKKEEAFVYKFMKTELPISVGLNDLYWPITRYNDGIVSNIPITIKSDTCVPKKLGIVDPTLEMTGATAGMSFNSADVIYKLGQNSGSEAIEAAWLGSGSVAQLNPLLSAIQIYDLSALKCSEYLDGPIQPCLNIKVDGGEHYSFIWMDVDTYADNVFFYHEHTKDCPYYNSYPHDYYNDQTYQNQKPLNNNINFPLNRFPCTCKAVNYSPFGSTGNNALDYNGMCDLLYADPFGTGPDFNIKSWHDTRLLDYTKSPQFSFFQLNPYSNNIDNPIGFGSGNWVDPLGKKMVLKTGRRYTYYRTSLRTNINSSTVVPYFLTNYQYKSLNVNCSTESSASNVVDLVVIIDNSRTQTYDLEITKQMAKNFCEVALKTNVDLQIGLISFAQDALILNYLTKDLNSLITYIDEIQLEPKWPLWLTNLGDALLFANNILTIALPVGNNCQPNDLTNLCKNLRNQIINKSNIATISNCPRANSNKRVVVFSDGQETINQGAAFINSETILKPNGIKIASLDIGAYSTSNTLMEDIASNNLYFDLQRYFLYSDVDINRFNQNLVTLLVGCFPTIPIWCKATRNNAGNWVESYEPSDMVINPGDYISYVHRPDASYSGSNGNSFTTKSLSFTIKSKLDGWDYTTNNFNIDNLGNDNKGIAYGAKPFWAKTYTNSVTSINYGGKIKFLDGYIPMKQPDISDMRISNGSYLQYNSKGSNIITWNQPTTFTVKLSDQIWNKILLSKESSNLSFALQSPDVIDVIIKSSNEPSEMILESYTAFSPVKYNYFARNSAFAYTENLFNLNTCLDTYVTIVTAEVLEAKEPYNNLENIHYPTIANISFPVNLISKSSLSEYLLPDKLGVSYYAGKGYSMDLDLNNLTNNDSLSAERLFLNPSKYASRNRGLTKKDQIAPIKISNVDNSWMVQANTTGLLAGIIKNTVNSQKFTPYQTNYEININNQIGLSLQKDDFQFWNPNLFNQWSSPEEYPLTFRKELVIDNFFSKIDSLLTDIGIMSNWRTDIYGTDYGIMKDYGFSTSNYIIEEDNIKFVTEHNIPIGAE